VDEDHQVYLVLMVSAWSIHLLGKVVDSFHRRIVEPFGRGMNIRKMTP
jgi:hypothetical protein